LARLAPHTDAASPRITKRQLSPLFLEYYWPLEVRYHLRQGIDPDKDPIVMVLIRRLLKVGAIEPGDTVNDFKKRSPAQYDTLVEVVARNAFDDVIPRFHSVHGAEISSKLFTVRGREEIELTGGGRQFLIEYKNSLITSLSVAGSVLLKHLPPLRGCTIKLMAARLKEERSGDGAVLY
jgi:hypothetical protein